MTEEQLAKMAGRVSDMIGPTIGKEISTAVMIEMSIPFDADTTDDNDVYWMRVSQYITKVLLKAADQQYYAGK